MKKLVIYTDLDGTLLDYSTYSFDPALPALEMLSRKGVPLVICSSKTRGEIEHYREKLANAHPFITENGGGIFIPRDYFTAGPHGILSEGVSDGPLTFDETEIYSVITLGTPYHELRRSLSALREQGFQVKGFGDMTVAEVASVTGLSVDEARMAKERDFDEPFVFDGDERRLEEAISAMGLNYTRGRFLHILGNNDKGKAVSILTGLYKKKYGPVFTAALGDSQNDISMLLRVDHPMLVRKPDGRYESGIDVPGLVKAEGTGPEGWNTEVIRFLSGRPED